MVKIAKIGQNSLKSSKMVPNGPKWSKMVTYGQNNEKLSKFWNLSKSKHLKGHSAPRVGNSFGPYLSGKLLVTVLDRTYQVKSPKGLQLEVFKDITYYSNKYKISWEGQSTLWKGINMYLKYIWTLKHCLDLYTDVYLYLDRCVVLKWENG